MNQNKQRDDYVNKKQNPTYLPTTEIQTNITFYAYHNITSGRAMVRTINSMM